MNSKDRGIWYTEPAGPFPSIRALNTHSSQMGAVLGLPCFLEEKTERLRNWSKVTQPVDGRTRTGAQVFLILSFLCLDSLWPRALGHPSPREGTSEHCPVGTLSLSLSDSELSCSCRLWFLPHAHPGDEGQDM